MRFSILKTDDGWEGRCNIAPHLMSEEDSADEALDAIQDLIECELGRPTVDLYEELGS